ncbi:GlsB/YeaQ/YmgE family stress response membrane protein [Algimonas porphyrae]|uniref:Membrane protein n=1 Tax=Algimonas porphyrae TaxID=1128113 RepID=A0ABQ5V0Q2_9PROT|nr:GlsB/YeaQ/YmgE family stress response membrane protein [Algimonas porphyrae]GLQ20754.1 membrane protein [Algimonas porphyrae]
MSIIWTIIVAALAGFVAKIILPDRHEPKGLIMMILAGILGGLLFTWLGQTLGFYTMGEVAGFIGTVIGAILVSIIASKIFKRG